MVMFVFDCSLSRLFTFSLVIDACPSIILSHLLEHRDVQQFLSCYVIRLSIFFLRNALV